MNQFQICWTDRRSEFTNCDWNQENPQTPDIGSCEGDLHSYSISRNLSESGAVNAQKEEYFKLLVFMEIGTKMSKSFYSTLLDFLEFIQNHLMMLLMIAKTVTRGPEGDEDCLHIEQHTRCLIVI